jgi:D-alanyl-D-alanine carboxypeptidase
MKRFICLLIGLTTLALTTQNCWADAADALIQQEMEKHQVAGLALTVIKDGQPIKTQCYGVANLEWNVPVTTDTVFEIGSITKQFTAACILLLVQDGKLSVDDLISQHLKNTPPSWAKITVRNLLSHTSGIPNYTTLDGFELRNRLTQEQFIKLLGAHPLDFQPGDSWSYCNSGFNLLGYIVENVSGENYWTFLHERILKPAAMIATQNRTPGVVIPKRAAGYEMANHIPINRDYDVTDLFSAGAIVSTLDDMTKWNAALDGDKLLNDASKQLWWTPNKLNDGKMKDYGFGWFLNTFEGHKNIGHGGSTSGFSATIQKFPDDHLAIIILTNANELDVSSGIAKEIAKLYLVADASK